MLRIYRFLEVIRGLLYLFDCTKSLCKASSDFELQERIHIFSDVSTINRMCGLAFGASSGTAEKMASGNTNEITDLA
ncbi:hypothetical protein SBOR_10063 [Sclerotinia borealis F-4128]|uniref:Uncharacterized protein n=1 Tax=Sclerotinia borealis (strain F-4128) TaxID=1432307 RepID=W9C0W5_SCLBF|nr:hypothetical protein SBOR_10063 [Sclerotinia borealis F-4128]